MAQTDMILPQLEIDELAVDEQGPLTGNDKTLARKNVNMEKLLLSPISDCSTAAPLSPSESITSNELLLDQLEPPQQQQRGRTTTWPVYDDDDEDSDEEGLPGKACWSYSGPSLEVLLAMEQRERAQTM